MEQTIKVRGTRDDVLELKEILEATITDAVIVSDPTPSIAKLNVRQSYRQNEVFEILISFAVSIASSVTYDKCKQLIESFQKKKKIEVHFEKNSKQAEEQKEKPQQNPIDPPDAP